MPCTQRPTSGPHFVKRLYTEEADFDFEGRYYRLKGARINPKPLQQPYPAIVNAGMLGAGRDFGAKHADFTFVNLNDIDELKAVIADIRESARTKYGREIGMLNHAYVVARDTEKEALDYERYFIDECGDWAATDAYVESFTRSGLAEPVPRPAPSGEARLDRRIQRSSADRHPRASR